MTTQNIENPSHPSWIIDYDEKFKKQMFRFEQRYPNRFKKMCEFLTLTPDISLGGRRVFPLMGDDYRGAWEYRVSICKETFRVFYLLDRIHHKVRIYYAGSKPNKVPQPPTIKET